MRQCMAPGLESFVMLAQAEQAVHLLRLQQGFSVRLSGQRGMRWGVTRAGGAPGKVAAFQRKTAYAVTRIGVAQAVQVARGKDGTQGNCNWVHM